VVAEALCASQCPQARPDLPQFRTSTQRDLQPPTRGAAHSGGRAAVAELWWPRGEAAGFVVLSVPSRRDSVDARRGAECDSRAGRAPHGGGTHRAERRWAGATRLGSNPKGSRSAMLSWSVPHERAEG